VQFCADGWQRREPSVTWADGGASRFGNHLDGSGSAMFVCPASSWSSSGCVPTRAQGIGESVLVLGASLQTSAVSFTPTRHGQVLGSFVELVGPIDRRLRFSAGLSAPGSRPADAGFERCPAWVAKRDERIRNRAGDFRSGRLPGSKLWRFPTSLERKVRKASTVARQHIKNTPAGRLRVPSGQSRPCRSL
jgi:hypothetical protein